MSWSTSLKAKKADFPKKLNELPTPSQGKETIPEEEWGLIKKVAMELAGEITRPVIYFSGSGHHLFKGDGDGWHEGITINVSGSST